jgi:hypothetical protein
LDSSVNWSENDAWRDSLEPGHSTLSSSAEKEKEEEEEEEEEEGLRVAWQQEDEMMMRRMERTARIAETGAA